MNTKFFAVAMLQSLPDDQTEALAALCKEYFNLCKYRAGVPNPDDFHEDCVEALGILSAFADSRRIQLALPEIGANKSENVNVISQFFDRLRTETEARLAHRKATDLFSKKAEEYTAIFGQLALYEFSERDFSRIHDLMNELRNEIQYSKLITDDHRRRLLKRLEAMQSEIHKTVSDIDWFWAFVGEAGITIRKFGEDIQPISQRVQELARLVLAVIFAQQGIKALPQELSKVILPDK